MVFIIPHSNDILLVGRKASIVVIIPKAVSGGGKVEKDMEGMGVGRAGPCGVGGWALLASTL